MPECGPSIEQMRACPRERITQLSLTDEELRAKARAHRGAHFGADANAKRGGHLGQTLGLIGAHKLGGNQILNAGQAGIGGRFGAIHRPRFYTQGPKGGKRQSRAPQRCSLAPGVGYGIGSAQQYLEF